MIVSKLKSLANRGAGAVFSKGEERGNYLKGLGDYLPKHLSTKH